VRVIVCDVCGEEILYSSYFYELKIRKTSQEHDDNLSFLASSDEPITVFYYDMHICQRCFSKIFSFNHNQNSRKLQSGRSIEEILNDMMKSEDLDDSDEV
jgi:hypothetical protein